MNKITPVPLKVLDLSVVKWPITYAINELQCGGVQLQLNNYFKLANIFLKLVTFMLILKTEHLRDTKYMFFNL